MFLGFLIALQLHGLIYGPLAAFIGEQFGTTSRYTGASLGYQLATLLGAGFTPACWPPCSAAAAAADHPGGAVPGRDGRGQRHRAC